MRALRRLAPVLIVLVTFALATRATASPIRTQRGKQAGAARVNMSRARDESGAALVALYHHVRPAPALAITISQSSRVARLRSR